MFCVSCGNQIPDGSAVCPQCGAQQAPAQPAYQQPVYQQPTYQQPVYQQAAKPAVGLAAASLVCGILSFFVLWWLFGTLAIIFGGVAKSKGAGGLATAGLVLGILGIVLSVILLIVWASAAASISYYF